LSPAGKARASAGRAAAGPASAGRAARGLTVQHEDTEGNAQELDGGVDALAADGQLVHVLHRLSPERGRAVYGQCLTVRICKDAEKIAFQGQTEAPGAVARRLPAPRVRNSSEVELGTVPDASCRLLFPTAGQAHSRLPCTSALLLTSHAPSSRHCFQQRTTTHTNSASKECERCKILEHKHTRAKPTHHEFNLNSPLRTSFARRFRDAVTRCGFLRAADRCQSRPRASFVIGFTQIPNSAAKISFFLCFSLKDRV